jgi:gentisate 1,2-dioxygenase
MACQVQLIRKGQKLKARHVAGSAIFHVKQGTGRSIIGGKVFEWGKGDIFVVPSWVPHEHACTGSEDAIFFSINDRPVMQKLGFYREQEYADNGGYQKV